MTKEEFEKFLVNIGGINRTYRDYKGPIIEADWFQIQSGWYGLVKDLINELISIGWNKRINQVKEKFGGLRFYAEDLPEGALELISKYEVIASNTCEECGEKGVLRQGKWLRTLCDNHSNGAQPLTDVRFIKL